MDPVMAILAGIGAASNLGQLGVRLAASKRQRKYQRQSLQAAMASLGRHRAQTEEDIGRARRRLEESLANRGVEDSTIAASERGYFGRRSERILADIASQQKLARERYKMFRKNARMQRISDYLNLLGLGARGASAITGIASQGEESLY